MDGLVKTFTYLSDAYASIGPNGGKIHLDAKGMWVVEQSNTGSIAIDTTTSDCAGLVGNGLTITLDTEVIEKRGSQLSINRIVQEYE